MSCNCQLTLSSAPHFANRAAETLADLFKTNPISSSLIRPYRMGDYYFMANQKPKGEHWTV